MENNEFKINYKFEKPSRTKILIIFFAIFITEIICGFYMGHIRKIVLNDAFSRIANAYYAIFVKPPRFASIGLVWNPLPSTLELPLVALAKIWKPIVTDGIAGVIITSLFAALSTITLYSAFVRLKISNFYTFILLSLYVFNPFIFFYGFNGMSEMVFFFSIIYSIVCMTLWLKEGTASYIVKIGFSLAMGFLCRYEAIPFAIAIGIGVLTIIFLSPKEKKYVPNSSLKEKYYYAEGTAIVLYTPILYTVILWIIFNWIISGNPLYFLNSTYSNTAQAQYAPNIANSLSAFYYVINKLKPFIPLFIGIVLVRIISKRIFKADFIVLAAAVIIMIIFHYLMIVKGNSYGWLRFFSYALPISFAWVPYELSELKKSIRKIAFIILVVSLSISSIFAWNTLNNPELSTEEHNLVISEASKQVADYINANLGDKKILADSFLTAGIILNSNNIDNFVISSSLNFYSALNNPWKYGIEYMLVPDNSGVGKNDAINARYPGIYKYGKEWCELVQVFDGYKLYKVNY